MALQISYDPGETKQLVMRLGYATVSLLEYVHYYYFVFCYSHEIL